MDDAIPQNFRVAIARMIQIAKGDTKPQSCELLGGLVEC
jgi:hypothetical protein